MDPAATKPRIADTGEFVIVPLNIESNTTQNSRNVEIAKITK